MFSLLFMYLYKIHVEDKVYGGTMKFLFVCLSHKKYFFLLFFKNFFILRILKGVLTLAD